MVAPPSLNGVMCPSPITRPRAGLKGTPVRAKKAPVTVQFAPEHLKSSPLVYPSPKISAPSRLKTYKTPKQTAQTSRVGFRRLGTDHSDEIQDFDDLTPQLSPMQDIPEAPKANLGKRDRIADPKSPNGARQTKKLVECHLAPSDTS